MWGEATPTLQRVEQQTFPRLCAIAEIGWSARASRNFQDFSTRLASFRRRLELLGVRSTPREPPSK
jgi:hexosaminidase